MMLSKKDIEALEGEEPTKYELAKVQSVEEMMPKPVKENQIHKGGNAYIGEDHYAVIEECLRQDATVEEACMAAGISTQAYYKHKNAYPEFARRVELARQFPKMMARAAVMKRIKLGDAKTALRYLELRDKKRYNTNPEVLEEGENKDDRITAVQFTSVPSEEGSEKSSQTSTEQKSASDGYASSSMRETPRENEEQALRNLDSLNFNNG